MVFVLLIEIPLSKFFFDDFEWPSVAINTLLPPILMGGIISVISAPSSKNTERIYERIVDIVDADDSFENQKTVIAKKVAHRRPGLVLAFSTLYLLSFSVILGSIYYILERIGFNIVSKSIFIFFISVVTFFAYRIRQTAKEYVLESDTNIVISFVTFLFLPILYLGKMFSEPVSYTHLDVYKRQGVKDELRDMRITDVKVPVVQNRSQRIRFMMELCNIYLQFHLQKKGSMHL